MRPKRRYWQIALALGMGVAATAVASAAGFETLSKTGAAVMTTCNPQHVPSNTKCKVTGLPGEAGYDLVAARSAPLIYNEITIGTLQEKVWRNRANRDLYIFGARVTMNAEQYDSSGAAFNVNDLFRRTKPGKAVSVAYFLDGATKALKRAGRTIQGMNETDEERPERDNTWVDFRIDANAAEPSGPSSAKSPWLLAKTASPKGFAINTLGLRVLNSDFDDPLNAVDFFTASYEPHGIPPPPDEDDGDDGDD